MTTQEERDAIEWEESWARYEANARLIAAAPELLAKARLDLAAFDRIVELIEEARTSRNLDAILDIMTDYAGSPALADVVKRLGTTTPAE